ncbi:glyoxalase [Stutzerimonas stutzeri]|uniref:Glyoxalase n=1 Tax=Stutzerimonas stutzeri TaxID=316 RepID=W8R2I1_STUST|nr:VOC family protein [Stutzerimonas stutzeri]AHL76814.1 glyoxalase [Stutzerimonas stutzeri]MCQ4330991.1 VOC family protein [Stutzerimonas stutzeri]
MFKVKATQHVLAVNDLERTEHYFLNELGFSLRFRVEGWSFISLGTFHVMLGHCVDEMSAGEAHDHAYFAYVNCEGIDDLYRDYQQRDVIIFQPLSDKPWGFREFGVATPEGHRIVFGQDMQSSEAVTLDETS